jgi:hypothetical protein
LEEMGVLSKMEFMEWRLKQGKRVRAGGRRRGAYIVERAVRGHLAVGGPCARAK